ncbi:MAG: type IV pilin protein [Burkholderiaceae bacterium]
MKTTSKGFTLIELMITLVVIAILAAIALPSYGRYVQKASRAEAKSALLEASQFMQRFYVMNNAYDQRLDGTPVALPAGLLQTPSLGDAKYTINFTGGGLTPTSYILQASATALQGDDGCGNLSISNTGRRTASLAANDMEVARCWR